MGEEHIKPKTNRSGLKVSFFVTILFLAIIVGVIYYASCCGFRESWPPPASRYNISKEQIENAVAFYAYYNNDSLPTLNRTYTNANCSDCSVVNISALLRTNNGTIHEAPYCSNLSANGNDNCGGNASLGCNNAGSYIWIVNTSGFVFSYCAGVGCKTNDSGYQGVWP